VDYDSDMSYHYIVLELFLVTDNFSPSLEVSATRRSRFGLLAS
jgi:hypothetical protein